ncbi:hypothetical protein [Flagellimonas eckloniae]|uniref:Lipocalin-like domain-containing protein n=1 Tax=Flagellimonas eckloniae TaxID=346185 RepID=A0A0Q1BIU4_9FLAO|nr:hypothetical protein [Allomuricauda eckloniae]KQC30532.1 hypothetical protein AAY42_12110 [Allomuricauda eckloniae]
MKRIFIFSLFPLLFLSCSKDLEQGRESLIGTWKVTYIKSSYGEFFTNGAGSTEVLEEDGDLGTFIFNETTVDFDFVRNDTLYAGSALWNLDLEKIRSGFFRENSFTLSIEENFIFDAQFGNATRNAEKNATTLSLFEFPMEGPGVAIEMELSKF